VLAWTSLPAEADPDPDPSGLSEEALAARADALRETMRAALEAGDATGGGMLAAQGEDAPGRAPAGHLELPADEMA
jgi:hypothetical protein